MKKLFFWAIALLTVSATALAQNNTYNMVITMANGTTITIGPNEVKNITFNEGEVEITGQTLDQFVQQVKFDSLATVTRAQIEILEWSINEMKKDLANLETRLAEMDPSGGGDSDAINELKAQIAQTQKTMDELITELEEETAIRKALNRELSDMIQIEEDERKAADEEWKVRIKELEDYTHMLNERIINIEDHVF